MTIVKVNSNQNLMNFSMNKIRNIALNKVATKFVLLIDGHFQASPDFVNQAMKVVDLKDTNSVYVIAAFEYLKYNQVIENLKV